MECFIYRGNCTIFPLDETRYLQLISPQLNTGKSNFKELMQYAQGGSISAENLHLAGGNGANNGTTM